MAEQDLQVGYPSPYQYATGSFNTCSKYHYQKPLGFTRQEQYRDLSATML